MKIGEAMSKSSKLYVLPKKKGEGKEVGMEEEESAEVEMEDGSPNSYMDMAKEALSSGDSEAAIDYLYDAIDAISAGMDTEDVGEYD